MTFALQFVVIAKHEMLEEVLYVEKRTVLKEEIRITSTRREVRAPQRVVLRSEEVAVEPFDEPQSRLP